MTRENKFLLQLASLGLFQTLPGDGASGRNIGRSFLEEDGSFWKEASEHRQGCSRSSGSICLSGQLQRFLSKTRSEALF